MFQYIFNSQADREYGVAGNFLGAFCTVGKEKIHRFGQFLAEDGPGHCL